MACKVIAQAGFTFYPTETGPRPLWLATDVKGLSPCKCDVLGTSAVPAAGGLCILLEEIVSYFQNSVILLYHSANKLRGLQ